MKLFRTRLSRIILWAFALNTVWEFGQCLFFYDMWSWPFWKSTALMWAAIFGDILIVLGLWKGACFLNGLGQFHKPSSTGYLILLLLSFGASIVLEWMAIYFNLWSYDASMPMVEVLNHKIGILPVLQITTLPALSVWLAGVWNKRKKAGDSAAVAFTSEIRRSKSSDES
jgi:hypothetical protein